MIEDGEIVLCDFGGTMDGYCSDITRCVFTGEPPAEIAEAYAVLHAAQAAGVAAATVGTPCEDVDRAARQVIADAGYGEYFIHRTGHGIGLEEHEDPYIVAGNTRAARRRPRLQRRAGDLRRRSVGDAPRGHRRRHRRRPRARSTAPTTALVTRLTPAANARIGSWSAALGEQAGVGAGS